MQNWQDRGVWTEGSKWCRRIRNITLSLTRSLGPQFSISGDKNVCLSSSHYKGGTFHIFLSPAFRIKKEKDAPLTPAVSYMHLTQSNQYPRMAYFGVTCSELLHHQSYVYLYTHPLSVSLFVCLSIPPLTHPSSLHLHLYLPVCLSVCQYESKSSTACMSRPHRLTTK